MIYERGNAAKQWMFTELDRRFGQAPFRVLDLAGGNGKKWQTFLETHPSVRVTCADFSAQAIEEGKKFFAHEPRMEVRLGDAQKPMSAGAFDAVVAMSAIEHVVDRPAFLRTAWSALKPGGAAYLNYDVGHFRSSSLKERSMVPISQALALVGVERFFMKRVDEASFRAQAERQGFRVRESRKHNLACLKGAMRGASDEALNAWFDFEERLGQVLPHEALDKAMLSTTLVCEKPS